MPFEFLTPNLVAIAVIVAGIAYLVWRDRDKIERHSILIVRRTQHGIEFLDRMAKRAPMLWTVWSSLGVLVGFVVMAYMFFFLLRSTIRLLIAPEAAPSIGLVLPTASSQASFAPGVFFIPFWYWIIGIGTVMVAHEMMHGVIARNEGFPIKSVGWFVLGILPGAFVEPEGEEMLPEEGGSSDPGESDAEQAADAEEAEEGLFGTSWGEGERQADDEEVTDTQQPDMFDGPWGEGSWIGQLRVLAAGSAANITVAILLFLLMFGMTTSAHGTREVKGIYTYEGVRINGVFNNTVADRTGFKRGMVIRHINGQRIQGLRDFARATDNFSINESVTIAGKFNGSTFNITARLGMYPDRNLSYRPAPIDPLLVWFEERYPGTIERFERYNDIVVEESVRTRIARWQWIRSEYDTLDARAHQRINTLKGRLPERKGGFLGISIASQPVTEVKEGMGMAAVFATIFMKFLFFMVLIHSGIGAANLLPAKPFDGGWMLSIIVHRVRSEWEHGISTFFTVTTIALILFNIGVPLLGSVV